MARIEPATTLDATPINPNWKTKTLMNRGIWVCFQCTSLVSAVGILWQPMAAISSLVRSNSNEARQLSPTRSKTVQFRCKDHANIVTLFSLNRWSTHVVRDKFCHAWDNTQIWNSCSSESEWSATFIFVFENDGTSSELITRASLLCYTLWSTNIVRSNLSWGNLHKSCPNMYKQRHSCIPEFEWSVAEITATLLKNLQCNNHANIVGLSRFLKYCCCTKQFVMGIVLVINDFHWNK